MTTSTLVMEIISQNNILILNCSTGKDFSCFTTVNFFCVGGGGGCNEMKLLNSVKCHSLISLVDSYMKNYQFEFFKK